MSRKIKKRTFEILELATPSDLPSKTFDIFMKTTGSGWKIEQALSPFQNKKTTH